MNSFANTCHLIRNYLQIFDSVNQSLFINPVESQALSLGHEPIYPITVLGPNENKTSGIFY